MCDEEKRESCENEVPCSEDSCHSNCGPDCDKEHECCCHCCDCEDECCDCDDECCCDDECRCGCCGEHCHCADCENECCCNFKSECLDLAKEVLKAMIISAAATASAVGVTALLTKLIRK